MAKIKEYSTEDVTVIWKPKLCIHSAICVKGLPEVFNPNERPWIKVDAASSERIIDQVHKCPSGALSIKVEDKERNDGRTSNNIEINIVENGPMIVIGNLEIKKADGSKDVKEKQAAFCRCGASGNKPYCDGSHNSTDFRG